MTNQQAKQILRYLSNNEQVFINAAYEGMSVVDLISKVSQDMPTPEREMADGERKHLLANGHGIK